MTIPEIWWNLNQTTPKKPVYNLACLMARLDTQTVLDLIEKYRKDQELSEQDIRTEIHKQKIRKAQI